MDKIQPFQNQPRTANENMFSFLKRSAVFRLNLFSFLFHRAKQNISVSLYRSYLLIFFTQFIFYLNYRPSSSGLFNILYAYITEQISFINFEIVIFVQDNEYLLSFYYDFMIFYGLLWIAVIFSTLFFSSQTDFSTNVWKSSYKTTAFQFFAHCYYLNYYCLGGIAVAGLVSNQKKFSFVIYNLQKNAPALYSQTIFSIILNIVFQFFEVIIDVFLPVFELKENSVGIRTRQLGHFLTFVFKYVLIFIFILEPQLNNSYITALIYSGVILTIFLITLAEMAYEDFYIFRQNLFMLFLLFTVSLCNLLQQASSASYLDSFPHLLILLFAVVFSSRISQMFVMQNTVSLLTVYLKKYVSNSLDDKTTFEFFTGLYYLFNNRGRIPLGHSLPLMYLGIHQKVCKEPECACQVKIEPNSKEDFRRTISVFYSRFNKLFQSDMHPFWFNLQKIEFSFRQNRNCFDTFRFAHFCNENTLWITHKVSYFNALLNIENTNRLADIAYAGATELKTESLYDIRDGIMQVQELMQEMIGKYKEFLEESLVENPQLDNLRELLWQTLDMHLEIENHFESKKALYANNYKHMYMYFLFLVNILNDDEKSPLLMQRLMKIKDTGETLGQKGDSLKHKFGENSRSMVVVATSFDTSSMNITHLYDNHKEFVGREREELIQNTINVFMPAIVSAPHHRFIEKFYLKGEGNMINVPQIYPVLHKDRYFVPCETLLRIIPDLKEGMRFVMSFTDQLLTLKRACLKPEVFDDQSLHFLIFRDNFAIKGINKTVFNNPIFPQALLKLWLDEDSMKEFTVFDLFPQLELNESSMESFLKGETLTLMLDILKISNYGRETSSIMKSKRWTRGSVHMGTQNEPFYVKLVNRTESSCGKLKMGMLYFYSMREKASNFASVYEKMLPAGQSTTKLPQNHASTPTPQAPEEKTQLLNVQSNYDSRELKELKETFMDEVRPKTDHYVIIGVALILLIKVGLFCFTYMYEQTLILDFFQNYPQSSIALSNQVNNFVKLMTLNLDLDLATMGFGSTTALLNIYPVYNSVSALQDMTNYVRYADLNITKMMGIATQYSLLSMNISQAGGPFGNVTVWNGSSDIHTSGIYGDTFFSMASQLVAYNLMQTNPGTWVPIGLRTAEALAATAGQKMNIYINYIWQNTINNFVYKSGNFREYKKLMTDLVLGNYSTFKLLFFIGQFIALISLIILVAISIFHFRKSTNQLILLFLKIDSERIAEFIRRADNLNQTLKFISEFSVHKIEMNAPLDYVPEIAESKTEPRKSELTQKQGGDSSQAKESLPGAKESLPGAKEEALPGAKNPSSIPREPRLKISKVSSKNDNSAQTGFVDRKLVGLLSLLLIPLVLLLANFGFYLIYNPSFNYLITILDDFIFYKDSTISQISMRYLRLYTNTSVVDVANYTNFSSYAATHHKPISIIFQNNLTSILATQIAANLILLNKNVCGYNKNFKIISGPDLCMDSDFTSLLTNGLETAFTYLNTQFDTYLKLKSNGASSADLWNSTKPLLNINYYLSIMGVYACNQALDDVNGVVAIIYYGFYILAFFEGLFVMVYLGVAVPRIYWYIERQRNFFKRTFVLLSLKTISENKKLLEAISKEETPEQKIIA